MEASAIFDFGAEPARCLWILPAGADRSGTAGDAQVIHQKDEIHVRIVLEVALIAMAHKAIILEPNDAAASTLFGMAALIFSLAIAFYFERQTEEKHNS